MAFLPVGSTFIVGDYMYTVTESSAGIVSIQAADKTKTHYADVPTSVTYQGYTYNVFNYDDCFSGCSNLVEAPRFLATNPVSLRNCFENCTALTALTNLPRAFIYSGCFTNCTSLQSLNVPLPDNVWDLSYCFSGCTSLTAAPEISGVVYYMEGCFNSCESLTAAPTLPTTVEDIRDCFAYCQALQTGAAIPASVTEMRSVYLGCENLTGEIQIDTNTSNSGGAFTGTQKGIWLTGSSSQLQALAATSDNGNVFVGEIPLSGSLTAERVGSDGGTTPEPEGNWLHVVLSISWSKFSTNSLSSITIYDNNILNPVTWYTDASKTSAIILPNWRPDPTVEAHTWLYIDEDTHTIQVNIADAYHTGEPVVITVPQVFRTIDFLAGGKGIAFGKVAEHEGFECAMDLFVQPWAGFIQIFAGSTPPAGWLPCDGSEVAVADYPRLHAVIGNTYGTPSDSDHFLLPDLRGRAPVGAGQGTGLSNRVLGAPIGAETHTLTVNEMPSHRHKEVGIPWFQPNRAMSSGAYTLADVQTSNVYTEYTGGGQAHNNIQPSLGINFIICTGEIS